MTARKPKSKAARPVKKKNPAIKPNLPTKRALAVQKAFGERLRAIRVANGWTQEELALRIPTCERRRPDGSYEAVVASSVAVWERGGRFLSSDMLGRLQEAGINLRELFDFGSEPAPNTEIDAVVALLKNQPPDILRSIRRVIDIVINDISRSNKNL